MVTMLRNRWKPERIRYLFSERNEKGHPNAEPLAATQHAGVVPKSLLDFKTMEAVTSDLGIFKLVEPGDFVISLRSFEGGLEYSAYRGILSPAYTVLRPSANVYAGFFKHLLKSDWFVQGLAKHKKGIRDGQAVPFATLQDDYLGVPPREEQERIANFLDEKTARIDALIAEKEKLQSTLEEWRSAELARICFGGVNATESTGNAWIPVLPAGWRCARLKHLIAGIEQGWSPECEARLTDDDEWGVLKAGAANGGIYRETEHKALPASLTPLPELEVKPGDVLVTRASGSADLVGSFAYVYQTRPHLMLSDKNFRLKFAGADTPLLPELLAWMCNTDALRQQVRQFVSGADGLAKNIGSGNLRELWLAVPPRSEQPHLVRELRQLKLQIDGMQKHLSEHIDRLREYRSSLISAAVTGQLDVDAYNASAEEAVV